MDVPNRLLAWGLLHLPSRVTIAPFTEATADQERVLVSHALADRHNRAGLHRGNGLSGFLAAIPFEPTVPLEKVPGAAAEVGVTTASVAIHPAAICSRMYLCSRPALSNSDGSHFCQGKVVSARAAPAAAGCRDGRE